MTESHIKSHNPAHHTYHTLNNINRRKMCTTSAQIYHNTLSKQMCHPYNSFNKNKIAVNLQMLPFQRHASLCNTQGAHQRQGRAGCHATGNFQAVLDCHEVALEHSIKKWISIRKLIQPLSKKHLLAILLLEAIPADIKANNPSNVIWLAKLSCGHWTQ